MQTCSLREASSALDNRELLSESNLEQRKNHILTLIADGLSILIEMLRERVQGEDTDFFLRKIIKILKMLKN